MSPEKGTFEKGTLQGMDTYPTKREKENHLQNAIFWGDMLVSWRVNVISTIQGILLMLQKSQGQPPGMYPKPVVNNGINYQPQLVSLPDFWLPSTVVVSSIHIGLVYWFRGKNTLHETRNRYIAYISNNSGCEKIYRKKEKTNTNLSDRLVFNLQNLAFYHWQAKQKKIANYHFNRIQTKLWHSEISVFFLKVSEKKYGLRPPFRPTTPINPTPKKTTRPRDRSFLCPEIEGQNTTVPGNEHFFPPGKDHLTL